MLYVNLSCHWYNSHRVCFLWVWTSRLNVNQNSMTVLVMVEYCELVFISPCLLFQTLIYHLLLKTRWNYKTLLVAFSMDKPIVRGINLILTANCSLWMAIVVYFQFYTMSHTVFNTYTTLWIGVSIIDRNACPVLTITHCCSKWSWIGNLT